MNQQNILFKCNFQFARWYFTAFVLHPINKLLHYQNLLIRSSISIALLMAAVVMCQAQMTTWNGSASSNWSDAANWSAGAPTTANDVNIPSGTLISPVIQAATIAEAKSVTIASNATLVIDPDASLKIDGSTANAITSSGALINYGSIDIGSTLPIGGNGIRLLAGSFENNDTITINNTTGASFVNINATCTNDFNALLDIGNIGGIASHGLRNRSGFENYGTINITNAGANGLYCELSSDFKHLDGSISVVNSTDIGVWNEGGSFRNEASVYMYNDANNGDGFLNDATIVNTPCAIMYMDANLNNQSVINNEGLWVLRTTKPSMSSGTFTNDGILENRDGSMPISQLSNNELVITKTIVTTPMSSIPNAFEIGAGSTFNIIGIYTDASFSTSAGTYVNNTFTPQPPLQYGINTFHLNIQDPMGMCHRTVTWKIDNQVCPNSSNADKIWVGGTGMDWINPTNWCPTGVPSTGDWVDLGDNATVMYNNYQSSALSKLDIGNNSKLTILPQYQIEIDGSLGSTSGSLLHNDGGTIINEGRLVIKNAEGIGLLSVSNPAATVDNYGDLHIQHTALSMNGAFAMQLEGSNNTVTNHPNARILIDHAAEGGLHVALGSELLNRSGACIDVLESDVIGLLVNGNSTVTNEQGSSLRIFDLDNGAYHFESEQGSVIDWNADVTIAGTGVNGLKLITEFGDPAVMAVDTQGIFAIWWYPDVFDYSADTQTMFEYLKLVRDECLNNLNMQDPPNPDAGYYYNIYIHHGVNDPFPSGWANGQGTDVYGMPYLTLPGGLHTSFNNLMHEGFHIFQYSGNNPNFAYSGDSKWIVETTAQWFMTHMNTPMDPYPDDDKIFQESTAKGQNPQLALWQSDTNGAPGDPVHWLYGIQQYGLQSLFNYLEKDKGVDPAFFTSGFYNNTPLLPQEYLYQNIGGTQFRDYITDWAAHNVGGFDYLTAAQVQFADVVLNWWNGNPAHLHPYILELTDQGVTNFIPQDETYKPRGWGYCVVKINNTQAATYAFDLAGDANGSEGAASHFEARIVIMEPGGPRYETVNMTNDLDGSKSVTVTANDSEVYLVISAVPDHFTGYQTYGFYLNITRS